jgi:predicted metalloenzyme YecM
MERWNIEPAAIFYPDDFAFPEQAFEQIKNVLQTLPKRL